MTKTSRNALLGTLGAALITLSPIPNTVHAEQNRRIGSWSYSGFEFVSSVNGWLDDDEEETRQYWLRGGVQYAFAATCDDDCTDIDLRLFNDRGVLQVKDTDADANPQIAFTPPISGTYQLKVVMFRCSLEPCGYDLDLYQR